MRLCKRLETRMSLGFWLERWGLVCQFPIAAHTALLTGRSSASYLPLISRIRKILAQAQKKSYTISVGKLTPSKLANFLEIECFVLVACPENSLIDSKVCRYPLYRKFGRLTVLQEFLKPIITPFELEMAISADRSWTGEYILDFGRLLEKSVGPGMWCVTFREKARPDACHAPSWAS